MRHPKTNNSLKACCEMFVRCLQCFLTIKLQGMVVRDLLEWRAPPALILLVLLVRWCELLPHSVEPWPKHA